MSMGPSYPNEVSDLLTGATYAIQHAVTVTRPDPSRAEIAMHLMAALAPQCGEYEKFAHMAIDAVAMADALIAALEKAR